MGKPNIIIINCDDLGYGDLSACGSQAIHTPNVDRLAEAGARFTSFYSCNAICTPSRFGLLTGRYPQRGNLGGLLLPRRNAKMSLRNLLENGIYAIGWEFYKFLAKAGLMDFTYIPPVKGIPAEEITIAKALKPAGYRTGMVGKWHLGEFTHYPEYNPVNYGFDFFFGVPHSNDMVDFALYRNKECLSPEFKDLAVLTGLYTRQAIEFIESAGDAPFFLYFAHTYPHQPLHASENFRGKSAGGIYGDAVEEIDWSVGELVRVLEARGQLKNTLIIFTSDNGPWYNGSPGGLRGRKGQSYEGGYRIPMIAHYPGRIPAGMVCDVPAMNIDWFPTCLALAGVELPNDRIIDGKDISGLLSGESTETPHDCFYYYHKKELEAIRVGKWKYIPKINTFVWPIPLDKKWLSTGSRSAPWLYNLETDPDESYNLKDNHPDVLKELQQKFQEWEKHMRENPGGWKS